MDLSTTYLGLKLENPLIASASPLSRNVDSARKLEDAGVGALVMYSLFEEELLNEQQALEHFMHSQEIGFAESTSPMPVPGDYQSGLDDYVDQLRKLKDALDIPVIASLNGVSQGGWIENAKALEEAGADALELNIYQVAANPEISGAEIEAGYLQVLSDLRSQVKLPIAMKLSSQFSSLAHMAKQMDSSGADGLVLFNRFYQPDIDLDTLTVNPIVRMSKSQELLLAMRWIGLLYGRVDASLAATGGVQKAEGVIKALLAGASAVQLCSVLLTHGPKRLVKIKTDLVDWLESHEYENLAQMIGSVSQSRTGDPAAFERANYMKVLNSYTPPPGVWS